VTTSYLVSRHAVASPCVSVLLMSDCCWLLQQLLLTLVTSRAPATRMSRCLLRQRHAQNGTRNEDVKYYWKNVTT